MTTTQPLGCSEEESAGGGCAPSAEAKILALLKGNETWTSSFIISNNRIHNSKVWMHHLSLKTTEF